MKKLIIENLIKNLIIVILLTVCYFQIAEFLNTDAIINDKSTGGNILVATSILSVTACFGAFAFSYERMDTKKAWIRMISHITTGILMLIIGISLEISSIITTSLIGNFTILNFSWLLLYVAIIFYDFWDLTRASLYPGFKN